MKDKVLVNKISKYIILKQKKNLKMNLIQLMDNYQEEEDLVKLKNVKVNTLNKIMLLKLCKIYQVILILKKLKLPNKLLN